MKLRVVISFFAVIMFSAFSAQAQQERFPQFLKHTVKPGETVKSIVEQFNVKSSDFLMLNDFPPTIKLKPGQVVLVRKLKEGERPAVEEANDAPAEEPVKKQPAKEPVKEKETAKEKREEAAEEQPVKEKKHVSLKETDTKSADGSEKTTRTEKTVTETSKPAPHKEKAASEDNSVKVEPVKEKAKPAHKEVAEKTETHSTASSAGGKTVEGPGGIQYTISDDGYHTVEKGQTFYRIALIYHLTVDQLRDLNGLPNYNVSVGQKLKVKK